MSFIPSKEKIKKKIGICSDPKSDPDLELARIRIRYPGIGCADPDPQ